MRNRKRERGKGKKEKGLIKFYIFLIINLLFARFPDAVGTNGMVVSSHKLASEAGLRILKDGGNAIDAAIATGVFSVGHAPASGWHEVARIVRPGGYLVLTIRPDIFESFGFRAKENELVDSGKWKLSNVTEPEQFLAKGEPNLLHEIRVYQILK